MKMYATENRFSTAVFTWIMLTSLFHLGIKTLWISWPVTMASHYLPPCVSDTPVCYQVEGSRQALRVTMFLDSCHFSELPSRLQNGGSLKLHTVLFSRGKVDRVGQIKGTFFRFKMTYRWQEQQKHFHSKSDFTTL